MAQVLFIKPNDASFILNDEKILGRKFNVASHTFSFGSFTRMIWSQSRLCSWLLVHIWRARIVYIWFADYHSLIPVWLAKILGKKSVVVVGGYDAAYMPELDYGAHVRPFRSFCARETFRRAGLLLPVSHFTEGEMNLYGPHAHSEVVHNGVDSALFRCDGATPRETAVLTVSGAQDLRTLRIKGIDLFVAASRLLPEVPFWIVGLGGEARAHVEMMEKGSNLMLFGRLPQAELLPFYARAKVYCQFSLHESFCMSLAEAMLCGCIPVVTANGALPEVAGDAGIVAESRDPNKLAATIRTALSLDSAFGQRARQRALDRFTFEHRKKRLIELLDFLLCQKSV